MITEVSQALGDWSVRLRENTPKELTDMLAVNQFGHIAFLPGRLDVKALGDGLLSSARYVGVYRKMFRQPGEYEIKGYGLSFWLGDSDGRGDIFNNKVSFSASTFPSAVRALLPSSGAIQEGTIFSIGGSATFSGNVRWDTPRQALTRIASYFTTDATDPVEWRVTNAGKLDAGKASQLYPAYVDPTAILVRTKESGRDLSLVGIEADLSLDSDSSDYLTHAYVVGQGEGDAAPVGSASAAPTPYRTLFNTPVRIAIVQSETEASAIEATVLAGVAISQSAKIRQAAQINTDEFDVKGTFGVGDGIWVHDPYAGFVNTNNEKQWQGMPINPVRLRVTEMTYPVPAGWTVAFRANDGTWHDLSNYYAPESGGTSVVVGDYLQTLAGGIGPDLDGRATPDTSVPGVPVFGTFYTGSYESLTNEGTRAQIQLSWTKPNNTDGSALIDLDHYEIRFRPNTRIGYPATHAEMATKLYSQLLTHGQPLTPPLANEWQTVYVGADATTFMLQELTPGVNYEFQIRAVDNASPPNVGAWSSLTAFTAARDTKAPDQPAPPSVAGSRVSVQIAHTLGMNSGGTFNLPADMDHLEIYVGGSTDFECIEGNKLGKLIANAGMIRGRIPAIGTFPIEQVGAVFVKVIAVDTTGNRSSPSAAAGVTALLIDDAHISDLTVSKVTAGTITATWLMAGTIQTAATGVRAGIGASGFFAYNAAGVQTFDVSASTGTVTTTGVFQTGTKGQRIVISDEEPNSKVRFYGTRDSAANALIEAVDYLGVDAIPRVALYLKSSLFPDVTGELRSALLLYEGIRLGMVNEISLSLSPGGYYYADRNQAQLGFTSQDGSSANDQLFVMDASITKHWGSWADYVDYGADQGIFSGHVLTGSNVTSTSIGYGTTRASTTYPICTIRDNQTAGNINRWQINAADTTGWTVEFGIATAGVAEVWFWGFRV